MGFAQSRASSGGRCAVQSQRSLGLILHPRALIVVRSRHVPLARYEASDAYWPRISLSSILVDDCTAISVESPSRAQSRPHRGRLRAELSADLGAAASVDEPGISWMRYFSALKRYKWLILLVALAGTGIGYGVTRFMTPAYQTQGTVWISE